MRLFVQRGRERTNGQERQITTAVCWTRPAERQEREKLTKSYGSPYDLRRYLRRRVHASRLLHGLASDCSSFAPGAERAHACLDSQCVRRWRRFSDGRVRQSAGTTDPRSAACATSPCTRATA